MVVPLHVAAKLERERDEALKERDEWRQHGHREADMRLKLMGTRDDARLKVERERDEARLALLAQMAREHLTCGWCGDMMHAPPGFTPPMTTEKMKLTVKIHMLDCPKHPIRETEREVEELRAVIHETIIENLHLADGEQCTLKKLKDAIGFEISPENAKCAAPRARFGSSDWRAEGWEAVMKSAKTGDRFTGQQRDGSWIDVTVRVLEGTMEGRHQIRFVYVGWEKNGQHCESTFECFATMHRRIESLPNAKTEGPPTETSDNTKK